MINELLKKESLAKTVNAIFIDMHGEATSEKNSFGHYFDGKVRNGRENSGYGEGRDGG